MDDYILCQEWNMKQEELDSMSYEKSLQWIIFMSRRPSSVRG
jgi:hypothetical protein